MERERGNEDRKEKRQHERSTAEEPERDTRGAQPEESPQIPEETATEKRARERTNGRLSLRPKTRKGERNRATLKKTSATRA